MGRPELAAHGLSLDLAPIPRQGPGRGPGRAGRAAAGRPGSGDRAAACPVQPLDTAERLAVPRVVTLVGTAHVGTTGQLP